MAIPPGDTGESCRTTSYTRAQTYASLYRVRVHSMLVDPSGKVRAELDEKEGIAFGEVGE